MPPPSLQTGRILRRHLITGFALLILPMLLLHQTGTKSYAAIFAWVGVIGPIWLIWAALLFLSAYTAYFMADRLIWARWMRRLNIDLYEDGPIRSLFRKWALCWRCLGYWYGGFVSLALWLFVLPVWYGALYFAFSGASFGAAITAFLVASHAKE